MGVLRGFGVAGCLLLGLSTVPALAGIAWTAGEANDTVAVARARAGNAAAIRGTVTNTGPPTIRARTRGFLAATSTPVTGAGAVMYGGLGGEHSPDATGNDGGPETPMAIEPK